METKPIANLASFNQQLRKAILAIGLFILVYLILLLTGSLIAIGSFFAGFMLMAASPSAITLLLGLGIIGMGVFIFIFLIKFIFKKTVTDRSYLIEIKANEEPELFALLEEIVDKTQTHFPKKVYLSSAVNARVFYDSNFWSMFMPIKKNLEIGLGLVNGVTKAEFKAILAHEFGHFSQGSMKIGSYVYYVNQVIYNLLYENEAYHTWVQRWASVSFYFAIFIKLAIWLIQGMQWVLQKIYKLVNLTYLGLSREMEFHADEVAARIAGPQPLIAGLARLSFVDSIFGDVLNHYNRRIPENVRTQNVFPMHRFAMQFMAKENQLELHQDLPLIDVDRPSLYDQSQLVIKDQWASHPSNSERAQAMRQLHLESPKDDFQPAGLLFQQLDQWQKQLTDLMFEEVEYNEQPRNEDLDEFKMEYLKRYEQNSFDPLFRAYYDFHNPISWEIDELLTQHHGSNILQASDLFDDSAITLVYSYRALENDLLQLEQIAKGELQVQSFDYAGKKYRKKDSKNLIEELKIKKEEVKISIKAHDQLIFDYFYAKAVSQGKQEELQDQYRQFIEYDRAYSERVQLYDDVFNHLHFVQDETPFEYIETRLKSFKPLEELFKTKLKEMIEKPIFQAALTDELRETLETYLSKDWVYFLHPNYDNDALMLLFKSVHGYLDLVRDTYFQLKKELLSFQANLEAISSKNLTLPV